MPAPHSQASPAVIDAIDDAERTLQRAYGGRSPLLPWPWIVALVATAAVLKALTPLTPRKE